MEYKSQKDSCIFILGQSAEKAPVLAIGCEDNLMILTFYNGRLAYHKQVDYKVIFGDISPFPQIVDVISQHRHCEILAAAFTGGLLVFL